MKLEAVRTTAVLCPDWPAAAVLTAEEFVRVPAGVFHANRVVSVTPPARALGVEVGLRRREAQRRCPELVVMDRDLAAEARRFEVVVSALDDLTPRSEIETPGWCSFATRGPSRYFGGDEAMSLRLVELVSVALGGSSSVQVGTADTRFAALQAAFVAGPGRARVVPPGATPSFLAPLPTGVLMRAENLRHPHRQTQAQKNPQGELVHVLVRLGLTSLGDFGELSTADVAGRFGAVGLRAHEQARGAESRLADLREPPDGLEVTIDLDPPVERVDQAAFIAKTLADELTAALGARGMTCAQVEIGAETEPGETLVRLWRGEGSLTATAIAERMRWQLDGWLTGSAGRRPQGGVVRLWLRPDQVMAATGKQLGFWGDQTGNAERAARAVARAQGLLGEGSVTVVEETGGRGVKDQLGRVGVEAVDVVDRYRSRTKHHIAGCTSGGDSIDGASRGGDEQQWPGQIPRPWPAVVLENPEPIQLLDAEARPIRITARGSLSGSPAELVAGHGREQVASWSGPWLFDERWWDRKRRSRQARMQIVTADAVALLVTCTSSVWAVEAVYE